MFFSLCFKLFYRLIKQGFCPGFKPVISDKADGIVDTLLFAESVDVRDGKTAIGPQEYRAVGIGLFEFLYEPFENGFGAMGGMLPGRRMAAMGKPVMPSKISSGWYMCCSKYP